MSDPGRMGPTRRSMTTRTSVRVSEFVSRVMITLGGAGTILAVGGVFIFLLWVVRDLFLSAEIGDTHPVVQESNVAVVLSGCDEYRVLAWMLREDAVLEASGLRDGSRIRAWPLLGEGVAGRITAVSPAVRSARIDPRNSIVEFAIGFADGTVRTCTLRWVTSYHEADEVPAELRGLEPGLMTQWDGGIAERTPIGQFRLQRLHPELGSPVRIGSDSPIQAVHLSERAEGPVLVAVDSDGTGGLWVGGKHTNLLTGEESVRWEAMRRLDLPARTSAPEHIVITDLGTNVLAIWRDGHSARFAARRLDQIAMAEEVQVSRAPVTSVGLLLGEATVLVGNAEGGISGWFVRNDPANEVDRARLVEGHSFAVDNRAAVRSFAASARERMFAAGTDDGSVHLWFMTSEKSLGKASTGRSYAVETVSFGPKNDALLATDSRGLVRWDLDPRHPEVTAGALFGKIWYERYDGPEYAWQSSSGTDDFEKKFSLVPLIFGTVKATFYSMLFGVPIALFAALYTSEFLSRRARARIKPVIEMMASLPSVVLGFLAALVLAPLVERFVPAVLCGIVTVPFAVLLGAYLWRLLPPKVALVLEGWRLLAQTCALLVGMLLAIALAPALESSVFSGDIRLWLDGQLGSGLPALAIAVLPLVAVGTGFLLSTRLNPRLRQWTETWTPQAVAAVHMGKFGVGLLGVIGISTGLGAILYFAPTIFGGEVLDLRGGIVVGGVDFSPFGTYDQRNSLVVGFIMGFAIIPIIYTLAEDALSSVPEHLRAASLGAGATPWQTATRIVIPTAMSGLFSAVMIGLGRAVGETMIVLMAAGNTPVLSMNAFSGFRTLSANIATELPEAAAGTTHYRTLYLAALVLFAMTFLINTLAETVRLRFRKRAYQL